MLTTRQRAQASVLVLAGFLFALTSAPICIAAQKTEKIRVALFLDEGAHARPQVFSVLGHDPSISAGLITGEDIRNGCLNNVDVLFMPGGSGKKEAYSLGEEGQERVRKFVSHGGIYIGVCAGCYLASCARTPYLGLIPATTVDKEHWRRGKGRLPIEFTKLGMEIFGVDQKDASVLYHNGPVLRIYRNHEKEVVPLCYFRGERVAKGGIAGLMVDTPAMVLCRYGDGLVLGISPHPEATPGLTKIELNAIHWLYNHRSQTAVDIPEAPAQQTAKRSNNTLSQRIYQKAENIFEHTVSSHYQHLHENIADQVQSLNSGYQTTTDCSGFVSYIIDSMAPKHFDQIYQMTRRTYPHSETYVTFFQGLKYDTPVNGWLRLSNYKDLQQGDIIAWKGLRTSGHIMIVASPPGRTVTASFHGNIISYAEVYVLDSSSIEHFAPQSLPPLISSRYRDGLGKGMVRLMLDDHGNVNGFWEGTFSHEKNRAINGPSYTDNIAFARLID